MTLKVTDTKGASSTTTVPIDVNATPVAVATAGVTSGKAPLAVVFSGLGQATPTVTR